MKDGFEVGDKVIFTRRKIEIKEESDYAYLGEIATIVNVKDFLYEYEVEFLSESVQKAHASNGSRVFAQWELNHYSGTGYVDKFFTEKLKESLTYLFQSNQIEVKATMSDTYDGEFLYTEVFMGDNLIYENRDKL